MMATGRFDQPGFSKAAPFIPLIAGALVYMNALANGFVGDDHEIIVNFPLIRDWRNIPLFFAMQDTLADGVATGYYRPLGRLSYMADFYLWGLRPFGYHLLNLAWHLTATWGLYLVVRKLADPATAVLAATLFAVAPVNVESVANITGRNNIQVACLLIMSLYAHIRSGERGNDRAGPRWLVVSLFFYSAALLTKEFALFFPLVVFAYRLILPGSTCQWPFRKATWRGHILPIIPYIALSMIYLVVRLIVTGSGRSVLSEVAAGHPADVIRSVSDYLILLVVPLELSVTHDIAYGVSLASARGVLTLCVILMAGLFLWSLRRDPLLSFFSAWFLVFLFPVSGAAAFNPVPVAERYLYVASMGGYTVMALVAGRLRKKWTVPVFIFLALYTGFFSVRAVMRNADWKDDLTLALSTVKVNPGSPVAHNQLGSAYLYLGRYSEAVESYRRAVDLNPSFPHAHVNLARACYESGMLDEAVREYLIALEIMPEYAGLHRALADVYYRKGMLKETERQLRMELALNPADADARYNLELVMRENRDNESVK